MKYLRRFRTPIQIGFGVLALGFLVWAIVTNWAQMTQVISSMNIAWLVAAVVLAYAGTLMNMMSWRSIVHSFGVDLKTSQASQVTFTAQIGKYIPGGVWPMVAGSQLGQRAGLPRTTTVITMTLQLAISLSTGAVVAVGTLFLVPALAESYWWLIVLVLVVGVVTLTPPVLQRLLGWAFATVRRRDLLPALRGKHLGGAIIWALGAWFSFGLHLWFLICAIGHIELNILVPSISGYALSWIAGFLAVFAPAGAGIREGILVLLFTGSLGAAAIFGIAVVSRMAFILVDITLFAMAAIATRRDTRDHDRIAHRASG